MSEERLFSRSIIRMVGWADVEAEVFVVVQFIGHWNQGVIEERLLNRAIVSKEGVIIRAIMKMVWVEVVWMVGWLGVETEGYF